MSSPLLDKSKAFALEIIKVCNRIKREKKESVLTNQLIRSGTGIGANIREVFCAYGRADFTAKPQVALKECSESEYWLKLLIESGYYQDRAILEKCVEVKKLLVASIKYRKEQCKLNVICGVLNSHTVRTRTRFFMRKGSGTFFVYRKF